MTASKCMLLVTGIAVGSYWARVLHMARKARRRTGRAANFFPAEPLGRALRIVWIPAVAAWIAAPFLAAFDARPAGLFASHDPWLVPQVAGIVIVLTALVFTLMCWRAMGRAWRMGIDPSEKNPLVISGPFALVRHPIYALSIAMMLGTVLVAGSALILIAAAVHIPLLRWESRREERHMLSLYGQQYADYCRTVHRWMPRFAALLGRRSVGPESE